MFFLIDSVLGVTYQNLHLTQENKDFLLCFVLEVL